MTETIESKTAPAPKRAAAPLERTPIRIERLLISHHNPGGVELPSGHDGKGLKRLHSVTAGVQGDVLTEIEHRPWMRVFRVTMSKRVRLDSGGERWEAIGKPFHIPDTWAVSVPADE